MSGGFCDQFGCLGGGGLFGGLSPLVEVDTVKANAQLKEIIDEPNPDKFEVTPLGSGEYRAKINGKSRNIHVNLTKKTAYSEANPDCVVSKYDTPVTIFPATGGFFNIPISGLQPFASHTKTPADYTYGKSDVNVFANHNLLNGILSSEFNSPDSKQKSTVKTIVPAITPALPSGDTEKDEIIELAKKFAAFLISTINIPLTNSVTAATSTPGFNIGPGNGTLGGLPIGIL